jgi:uncharacterized protein
MSQDNSEIVRRVFEAYEREGVSKAIEMFDPEVVWHPADEAPQHGIEAAIACMRRWEEEWEGLSMVPEQFIDGGETVLVAVRFSGRGRASGVEVDDLFYEVFTVRNGRIVRMDEFTEREAALEAAGLRSE